MSTILLTIYVLMWPLIVACVLFVLVRAYVGEVREARNEGRPII